MRFTVDVKQHQPPLVTYMPSTLQHVNGKFKIQCLGRQ